VRCALKIAGKPVPPNDQAASALWYVAPGCIERRDENLNALKSGEVRVRAMFGAISCGTEALVLAGSIPASEFERMRSPHMGGKFPFPVKYGYAVVGTVERGPADLIGRSVFVLHPHQSLFDVPVDAVTVLPDGLPARRTVLAANMETALNALWDGAPGPADRIAIIGSGVLGALVASLCWSVAGLIEGRPARVVPLIRV
jgi:hypothetical protein